MKIGLQNVLMSCACFLLLGSCAPKPSAVKENDVMIIARCMDHGTVIQNVKSPCEAYHPVKDEIVDDSTIKGMVYVRVYYKNMSKTDQRELVEKLERIKWVSAVKAVEWKKEK